MKASVLFFSFAVLASAPYLAPGKVVAPVVLSHALSQPVSTIPSASRRTGLSGAWSLSMADVAREIAPEIALCTVLLLIGSQWRRMEHNKGVTPR